MTRSHELLLFHLGEHNPFIHMYGLTAGKDRSVNKRRTQAAYVDPVGLSLIMQRGCQPHHGML
ncbi:hypothetical protein D3C73_1564220 [compost metagenome]